MHILAIFLFAPVKKDMVEAPGVIPAPRQRSVCVCVCREKKGGCYSHNEAPLNIKHTINSL